MASPISQLPALLDQSENLEELLYQLHQPVPSSILEPVFKVAEASEEQGAPARRPAVYRDMLEDESTGATQLFAASADYEDRFLEGRNVVAGAARSLALQVARVNTLIEEDPLFQESLALARGRTMVIKKNLQNIFLMMKYGLKDLEGDIIEFGCYAGGSAIFMANVARGLGMKSTIYTLDTFEGMPATDTMDFHLAGAFGDIDLLAFEVYREKSELNNIIAIKGLFQETVPTLLQRTQKILLAHIDCDIYSAVKYAIGAVEPVMHEAGGYLVFDDPLCPKCLGAFQAVEEMLIWKGFRAEQSFPHLVYRMPRLV